MNDFGDGQCDHAEEEGPDETNTLIKNHMRAEGCAEELTGSHQQAGKEQDFSAYQKGRQRNQVAGRIHHLGVGGSFFEILSEKDNKSNSPE